LKRLLSELLSDFARKTPILYIDNASAIKLTKNPEYDDIGIEHIDGRKQLAELRTVQNPLNVFDLKYHAVKLGSPLGSNEETCAVSFV
jgi:hypothetical protein